MNQEQLVQHLTPPPGVEMPPYPARRDLVYRWSLVAASLGVAAMGAALLSGLAVVTWVALAWLLASTLLAAWVFLVWVAAWRTVVLALTAAGVLASAALPGVGAARALAALSIMAAKEAHCFHYRTGKIIPWVSLAAALAGLAPIVALRPVAGLLYLAVAALWAPLLRGRFRLPLFQVGIP